MPENTNDEEFQKIEDNIITLLKNREKQGDNTPDDKRMLHKLQIKQKQFYGD